MALWKTYGFDNDTKRYLDAVAITGGSISIGTAQVVNQFVESLKGVAVWDSILDMGVFVGNDFNTACVKLKWPAGTSPYLISGGGFAGPFYNEQGVLGGVSGNGAGFLDTRIPQNMFQSQNRHMSVYHNLLPPTTFNCSIGSDDGTSVNTWRIESDNPATTFIYAGSNAAGGPAIINSITGGLYVGINSAPSTFFVNALGTGTSFNAGVISPCTGINTQYILALNRNKTVTDQSRARISFYSLGLSLTPSQVSGFYSAVQQFQSGLGRAV